MTDKSSIHRKFCSCLKISFLLKSLVMICGYGFASITLVGCLTATIDVPLTTTIDIQDVSSERLTKSIAVLIDNKTVETTATTKPMALADSFQFEVGKSIKSNVLHVIHQNFTTVEYYNDSTQVKSTFDYFLKVKLIEFNPVMGKTVFSNHKCFLKLDYNFYDSNMQTIFTVNSISSGEAKATGSEISKQIGLTGSQIGFKLAMGRTWDIAMKDSLNQFLHSFNKYRETQL